MTPTPADASPEEPREDRFPLTRLAAAAIEQATGDRSATEAAAASPVIDLARAREVLATVKRRVAEGAAKLAPLVPAVEIEIAIAAVEDAPVPPTPVEASDPLFRLHMRRWALAEGDLATLVPLHDPRLHVLEFDYDVADFMSARTFADLPASPTPRQSYMVAFSSSEAEGRNPLVVDSTTAQILKLSDGTRTASDIARELKRQVGHSTEAANLEWIESLLLHGLISLQDTARVPLHNADAGHLQRPSKQALNPNNRR
jgi:hypothetical protein